MRPSTETILVTLTQLAIVLAVLGVWQFFPDVVFDETLIGRPSLALAQTIAWLKSGVLLHEALATLSVVFYGLLLGGLAGFAVGLLASLVRPAERLLEPAIGAFAAMPKSALVPLFILWFGVSVRQEVIFTALVVFFFFFFATVGGVKSVSRPSRNMLTLLGASGIQKLTILYIPASFKWLLAGARLATPHAFTAAITTEIIASRNGLGHLVKVSASILNPAGVISAVALVILLSVLLSSTIQFIGNRVRWRV